MKKYSLHCHFLLLSLIPILFLYTHNIEETFFYAIIPSLFFSFFFTLFLYYFLNKIYKNSIKNSLICSITLIYIFSFGHIYEMFKSLKILEINIGKYKNIFLIIFFIYLLLIYIIIKIKNSNITIKINFFLNYFTLILFFIILVRVLNFYYQNYEKKNNIGYELKKTNYPDIIYIILDAYGRDDIISNLYNDSESFLSTILKKNNFYVAEKSRCNYPITLLSLSSSLNYNYLL